MVEGHMENLCKPSMLKRRPNSVRQSSNMTLHCFAGNVEVVNGQVTICVDALKGTCHRTLCKYYHEPIKTKDAKKDKNEQAQLPLV